MLKYKLILLKHSLNDHILQFSVVASNEQKTVEKVPNLS